MKNKSIVVTLTLVISGLCLYYLSFTWMSAQVQKKATLQATNESGEVDFNKKQAYLDEVWHRTAFRIKSLNLKYTYEEIRAKELSLGLDLQGGMHVTLELSPQELIHSLAGNTKDEGFLKILKKAAEGPVRIPFVERFRQAFAEVYTNQPLRTFFAIPSNNTRINKKASDEEVIKMLVKEIDLAVDRSFEILHARIDQFGTSQPNIQKLQGSGRIQVELPGVNNPERVRKLLKGVAQLKFWEVYNMEELQDGLDQVNKWYEGQSKGKKDWACPLISLMQTKRDQEGLIYGLDDVEKIKDFLTKNEVKSLLPKDLKWMWGKKPKKEDKGISAVELYPIKKRYGEKAALEGDVVVEARQVLDQRNHPAISLKMNGTGTRIWKRVTAANIGRKIAISLDDQIHSAPIIKNEIPSGQSEISGSFSIEEAQDLANVLRTGSLPAPVKIVEEAIIGPTLSEKAQTQGIFSMLAALFIVIIFMILYYAHGGVIANVALLFNILFILGVLAQLNASLTLPGIAGIVLTIGMAVDANVLIFERIREELKTGVLLKTAIQTGYQKAYSSIIDSNVTTFLTGLILYLIGQGPVRGFATTLMLGIVSSFFSAVFITKVLIYWAIGKKGTRNLSFSFPYNRNILTNLQFDFLRYRHISYIISGAFICLGLCLIVYQKGLNMGIDFTGGRSYVVAFGKTVEPTELKSQLSPYLGEQGAEIKTYGSNNVLKVTTGYRIHDEDISVDEEVQRTLVDGIEKTTKCKYIKEVTNVPSDGFTIASASRVGATIAGDIRNAAQQSVLLSLLVIFLYILIRFNSWRFGLSAVLALFHDSLAVISAFAIARAVGYAYEVDQVFVAAILTVIGYSINDTVVIFDRVRERMRMRIDGKFIPVANQAINETLSRTLITSLTTLVSVVILFLFGGEVLRGFSFVMLVGVLFGTYSSIFIATPLVRDLQRGKD